MNQNHLAWLTSAALCFPASTFAQPAASAPGSAAIAQTPAAASSSMPTNTGMSRPKEKSQKGAAPNAQASEVTSDMPTNTGMSRHKPKKPKSEGFFARHRKAASAPAAPASTGPGQ
jgi:hypothetical protein